MNLCFVHDNHVCRMKCGSHHFENSTFHLFLRGFGVGVWLSAPVEGEKDLSVEAVEIEGVRVRLRPGYGKAKDFYRKGPGYWRRAYRALRRHIQDADAVVICGPCSSAILAYLAAKRAGKTAIAYFIGDPREVVPSSWQDAPWLLKMMAKAAVAWEWFVMKRIAAAHAAVVLGDHLHQELRPIARRIMKGATSLVGEDEVCPPKQKLGKRPLQLLTVSRLSAEKGLEVALDAVKMLEGQGMDVRYAIAGEGPLKERLLQEIRTRGLEGRVQLLGRVPYGELKETYRKADILLLPSRSEGVPKVLFEAMAAGIPIVATNVGGVGDMLGGGERGWLCPPGDPHALARGIAECVQDEALRAAKLRNAHAYIKEHTREAQAKRLVAFIQECLC